MTTHDAFFHLKHLDSLAERSGDGSEAQRTAFIDMGSNSFRLIVMEYVHYLSFKMVDEIRETVRLSEGMASGNIMSSAAIERAIRALRIYAAYCAGSGIDDIVAVGTSAIRDAENQAYFLRRVQNETGISVRVLSGEEEAYYAYLAAVNSTTLENGYIVDLGGGSMEIVQVKGRALVNAISLPLGAVRVTEGFFRSDPVKTKEVKELQQHLRAQFEAIPWFKPTDNMMVVGEGGTLRLIGRLIQKQRSYPFDQLHGFNMTLVEIDAVRDKLAGLTVAERASLPGMKTDRADISLGGTLVVAEALRTCGGTEMMIASEGLREGLFYERFLNGNGIPLLADVRRTSVLNLAHLYRFQERHARHIAHLTLSMFDQLTSVLDGCGAVERELLWAASMLHDIGVTIDYHDHHKHSAYLILNGSLTGYNHREIALIALMARYHRKGNPTPDEFTPLLYPHDDRRLVQLATLLRLAEQLDRSRDGVVKDVRLRITDAGMRMNVIFRGDEQVALWALENHREIFERAFGMPLQVIPIPDDRVDTGKS
jgi:exopolyphosphatase/guanosine-5'-triphosphate,3'-diphosphate pyrophosphatase